MICTGTGQYQIYDKLFQKIKKYNMKTSKILTVVLSVVFFISFSFSALPSGKDISLQKMKAKTIRNTDAISIASMDLYSTDKEIIIDYDNPGLENLTFVIYDLKGFELAVYKTSLVEGEFIAYASDLAAAGGSGSYYVVMYTSDGKKKVITGTVVIIRE